MFMGFTLHIYIIFGTNLLTGGPAHIAVFCLFQCFEEKEYQTESKRNESFGNVIFSKEAIQETWSLRLGSFEVATRQNLGGTNLGLRRSCSAGETSLWEGEIITIVITNDPLIGRGSISINIFSSTISSQTLVHLLYPILVSMYGIGTCGLLVVLITPCS